MAKTNKKNNYRARRDIKTIANRMLPRPRFISRSVIKPAVFTIADIEDRRTFHPDGMVRPARSLSRPFHRLAVVTPNASKSLVRRSIRTFHPAIPVQFDAPRRVLVCIRRNIRKEVMHALNKSGKAGQKKPRRNYYSDVRC